MIRRGDPSNAMVPEASIRRIALPPGRWPGGAPHTQTEVSP